MPMLRQEECIRPGILGEETPGGNKSPSQEFFFGGLPWIAGQGQAEVNISFVSPCEPSTFGGSSNEPMYQLCQTERAKLNNQSQQWS